MSMLVYFANTLNQLDHTPALVSRNTRRLGKRQNLSDRGMVMEARRQTVAVEIA